MRTREERGEISVENYRLDPPFRWVLGRFIPDEFLILISAFMDRGSVTYKNPVFFFRQKKYLGVALREKA